MHLPRCALAIHLNSNLAPRLDLRRVYLEVMHAYHKQIQAGAFPKRTADDTGAPCLPLYLFLMLPLICCDRCNVCPCIQSCKAVRRHVYQRANAIQERSRDSGRSRPRACFCVMVVRSPESR